MLDSKTRKQLEALAVNIDAIFQVGKSGISDNLINSLNEALLKRELVKIAVLKNAESLPREAAQTLAEKTASEVVACRGGKVILYKLSNKEGVKHVL